MEMEVMKSRDVVQRCEVAEVSRQVSGIRGLQDRGDEDSVKDEDRDIKGVGNEDRDIE
ncbi:hypothetical protein VKT23_015227 [Stygiomarasmius scandens]|uniref:Uncharacterized protein n=1 Tax=Marasmiellus scandens TaxID=2682957 RepID=A0ABR1J2Z5_9AGAR